MPYPVLLVPVFAVLAAGCGAQQTRPVTKAPAPVATPAPEPAPVAAAPAAPAPVEQAPPITRVLHLDNVYFPYGKADLRPEARALLKQAVDQLLAEPDSKFEIAGHCDERGTDEYNMDLGWKRAYAVRDYLVRMGVATERLYPISYGRARPAVSGSGEDAWSKNRRGEMAPRP